jgi:hypothetical protein
MKYIAQNGNVIRREIYVGNCSLGKYFAHDICFPKTLLQWDV